MTHAELVERAGKWLRGTFHCRPVFTAECRTTGREEPDAIGWTPQNRGGSILVECKTSLSDFYRDHSKPWRLVRGLGLVRYYLTPAGLLTDTDRRIPPCWGLAEVRGARVEVVKGAKRVPMAWWNYDDELELLSLRCSQAMRGLNAALDAKEADHDRR